MKRQTFLLVGLLVLVLAVPVIAAEPVYANISNRDDAVIFLNEICAEIIQMRETDDPESPMHELPSSRVSTHSIQSKEASSICFLRERGWLQEWIVCFPAACELAYALRTCRVLRPRTPL